MGADGQDIKTDEIDDHGPKFTHWSFETGIGQAGQQLRIERNGREAEIGEQGEGKHQVTDGISAAKVPALRWIERIQLDAEHSHPNGQRFKTS